MAALPGPVKNAIVVGGSSGMGFAAAQAFFSRGGRVLLCSRSEDKLAAATKRLGEDPDGRIKTRTLDNTKEEDVKAVFEALESNVYDVLVITALGRAPHGGFLSLDVTKAREAMEGKLWGPWYCAKYAAPKLRDGGGIVFCSGVLCRRPGVNCTPLVAGNGAVEALTRALALELGPRLRVNCFSPGFFDTERYDHLPPDRKALMLEATGDSLPLKKVGVPAEAGEALHFLATSSFTTGVILDVDGGHQVRQYSYPNDIYLRLKREREGEAASASDDRAGKAARL
eukprot:TRINITY_DN114093_c0_g1_i1.p1 TRINITY_DN114093_c0_g1~~TRINITY_DN114093_c0_g1_i1.p1  ORF type:complete len:284 (-),score=50.23 TRINITY_DN114093_c0_g1_i1:55-906(-)